LVKAQKRAGGPGWTANSQKFLSQSGLDGGFEEDGDEAEDDAGRDLAEDLAHVSGDLGEE
jgi:hypothetical protein